MPLRGVLSLRSLAFLRAPDTWINANSKTFLSCLSVHACNTRPASNKSTARHPKPLRGDFDTLGAWNNRLPVSVNVEQSIKKGHLIPTLSLDNVGGASLISRRKTNEDRYAIAEVGVGVLLFSVFDGHGGSDAVEYASQHMASFVATALEEEKNLHKVLQQSFIAVNEGFTHYYNRSGIAKEDTTCPGTTATVCLLRDGVELVVGYVGDSRAMLCREGRSIRLTMDHTADLVDERNRIENCGGKVVQTSHGKPRVQGRLEMTRSIGDLDLRPYGVIEIPDTRSIEVKHHRDAFLVLLTDGVSFALNDQELVNIICQCKDPEEAARFVTDNALQFGSEDNATAVVVPLGSWGKYERSSSSLRFSFGQKK